MIEAKFNEIIEKIKEINKKDGFVTMNDITKLIGDENNDELYDEIVETLEKEDITITNEKELISAELDDDIDDIEIESLDDEDIDLIDLNEDITKLSTSFKTDDPVRMYLKEIGDIPLLGPDEEAIVAKTIHEGQLAQIEKDELLEKNDPNDAMRIEELDGIIFNGAQAKETLINANLRLVVSIAKKHVNKGLQFLDLIQEGNIGLMKAVDKFDCSKGFKFSTYATWWIRQAITRAIADQGRIVRIPVHMVEQINKVVRVQRKITQEKKQEPTLAELSKELGISEEKIKIIKKISQDPVSLESPVGEEEDSTLGDFIPDTSSLNPDEYTSKEMLKQELDRVLSTLTEREERVLRRRYGLDDGRTHTLEEVGAEFGVTRERIRQIEFKAIRKIKQPTKSKKLLEYLND